MMFVLFLQKMLFKFEIDWFKYFKTVLSSYLCQLYEITLYQYTNTCYEFSSYKSKSLSWNHYNEKLCYNV